jgi:uncharacterized protein
VVVLDVVRGLAVGGILLANVLAFFGWAFIPTERAAALPSAAWDAWADRASHVLVEGKFYSTFSLLFGIGFGLQLMRGGEASLPRFRRRLRILLGIGAAHAVLLWAGDILMMYALLGFTLPWFARKTDAALLRWSALLLAMPTALYAVAVIVVAALGVRVPAGSGDLPPEILGVFERMGTGTWFDAFVGNLVFLAGRWIDALATVRFPKVLGMFVLGLWAVRRGIVAEPQAHRELLVRWRRLGWLVGLPANVGAVWAASHWSYGSLEPGALLGVAGQAVGFPLLAIGYVTTMTLAVLDHRRLLWLAPMGRMALTNYLTHSLVCVVLAYGFGVGLWWQVGASSAMGIGLLIIAAQIPASAWWLSRFRYGPAEWVWRRLTYGQPLAFRV